jgi:serine/threonine-protein kinase 24/25/MST4
MKASVFKEDYIAIILRELLKGLEYLHGEGKLHRGTVHHPMEVIFAAGRTASPLRVAIVTIEVVLVLFIT